MPEDREHGTIRHPYPSLPSIFTYVDDYCVSYQLPKARQNYVPGHSEDCAFCAVDGGLSEDVALMNASVAAYAATGVERDHDKAYRYQTLYETLGAEVDGCRGCASALLDKRRQVCTLAGRFLTLPAVAKAELQSIIGSFAYPSCTHEV